MKVDIKCKITEKPKVYTILRKTFNPIQLKEFSYTPKKLLAK